MNSPRPKITTRRPTSIFRSPASFALTLICSLRLTGGLAADVSVTKGELQLGPSGVALVIECGANRVLRLGVMASAPYFNLIQNYAKASESGKSAVLVEVKGELKKSKTSDYGAELVIESPKILSIARGTCTGKAPAKP
jgi:hypothetical protein